jgi:MFS transporter, UMF1 family
MASTTQQAVQGGAAGAAAASAGATGRAISPPPVGKLGLFGWLLFEWSAQPFYSLITTFLFAPYFANGFMGNPVQGQQVWGYAAALAGITIAFASPILGAFADASGRRKPWILLSSIFFIAGMASLWIAEPGQTDRLYLILAAYVVAAVSAELNTVFVNAMMPGLVPESQYGRLSGASAAIGYLGGLIALLVVSGLLVGDVGSGRTLLGFEPLLSLDAVSRQGDRLVGPFCAVWFAIFVLPLLLFTPDRRGVGAHGSGGLAGLGRTLAELPRHRNVLFFLIARMLYVDGLGAVFAFGGIYGAALFGWQAFELGLFGIILIISAMIGSALGGWFDDKIGAKAVIMIALVLAIIATLGVLSVDKDHVLYTQAVAEKLAGSGFMSSAGERIFIAFAALVGLVAGPLNASSRSLMARLAPADRVTQFFGLFAFSGKVTSFIAPLAVAALTAATGNQRYGVGIVLLFLLAGLLIMLNVRAERVEPLAATPRSAARPAGPRDIAGSLIVAALFLGAMYVMFGL